MIRANENFRELTEAYLFSEVGRKIRMYRETHPNEEVVRMDIGDVTLPIFPCVAAEMKKAVEEMSKISYFRGYGPEQGYPFLRNAVADNDYRLRGIDISPDEIFISDGAKSDLANLGEILSPDSRVAVADPSYPAYVDDSAILGFAGNLSNGKWTRLICLESREDKGFMPELPSGEDCPDVIFLCSPNNPTGECIRREGLEKWVEYALRRKTLIIYDSAYEAYVREDDCVRSIYEIEGAEKIAIEVRSYSKTAGFTGLRCGYTVVPKSLKGKYRDGSDVDLNRLWLRRQTTMFNGVSYVVQKGAAALYTPEGREHIREATDYYLNNARIIRESLDKYGFRTFGGINSPYVWVKGLNGESSWDLFDICLEKGKFSTTPGSGFGHNGDGYIRLTGFNTLENTVKVMAEIRNLQ